MEFGMAMKQDYRVLKAFSADKRNPRLAPPSQSLQIANRVRVSRNLFETSTATRDKT